MMVHGNQTCTVPLPIITLFHRLTAMQCQTPPLSGIGQPLQAFTQTACIARCITQAALRFPYETDQRIAR